MLRDAIYRADFDKAQQLVGGLDLNFVMKGSSPLSLAAMKGDGRVVRLLLDLGALLEKPGNEWVLTGAARNGDHELIDLALAAGHDIHIRPPKSPSPLQAAACSNRPDTMRYLVERGATKNDFDLKHCSWVRLNSATIKFLLTMGVEVPPDIADDVTSGRWG